MSWSWDFGDGATSNAQNPSHSYASAAASPYTVTLTVTDDGGASDSASGSVTVTEPVNADFDLEGTAESNRNKWTAIVTDLNGNTLNGSWSESGAESCSENVCTLGNLNSRKVGSVVFTEATTGAQVTVNRP